MNVLARMTIVAVLMGTLSGCGSTEQYGSWRVAPDSACSSLSAFFPLEQTTLQTIVGPSLEPARFGNEHAGRLGISVHACPEWMVSGKIDQGAGFALATVPLTRQSAPFALAGMGEADLDSLVLFVGTGAGRLPRFMRDSSFAVISGESSLSRQRVNGSDRITANIAFQDGTLSIAADFTCTPMPFHRRRIVVGTGIQRYSLMFGESFGRECNASRVTLQIAGKTPFTDLKLTEEKATASRESNVSWNYRTISNMQF